MRTQSLLAAVLGLTLAVPVFGQARYAPATAPEVRQRIAAWLDERKIDPAIRSRIDTLWNEQGSAAADAQMTTELAIASWCLADPVIASAMQSFRGSSTETPVAWTTPPTNDPYILANLQAYAGRKFAERRMFDEALEQSVSLDLALVIDPAATLFYKAVAAQAVLDVPLALAALDQLTNNTDRVPTRYSSIATLMQTGLDKYEEKSLDEISRLMADSERRLDLGRSGERVQGVQEKIVAGLDELIKKLEAQQGGGGGGGGAGGNSNESSSPADDSVIKGSTAPGETDDKKFSKEGRWGDLPAKQQAAAKNLINRNFPSHYGEAIEKYFKKLSGRPAGTSK